MAKNDAILAALHVAAHGEQCALYQCHVNGQPATAVVLTQESDDGESIAIRPLFVYVDDTLAAQMTGHDGEPLAAPKADA